MREFYIGRYRYTTILNNYHLLLNDPLGRDDIVKSYDQRLHQSLDEILRKRCLSSRGQIEEFLRGSHLKSIMKPILDQEPVLSKWFSKEELGKLSLLWIAILAEYEKSAELLVRSGADVNKPFGCRNLQVIDEKWTVLHLLLQMDPSPENERLIRLVVDHGADLQAQACMGQTALHYALRGGRVQMTEMLLEKGADVNFAENELGMTPLLDLLANGSKAINLVPLLVKHGADVFAKNRHKRNALHLLTHIPVVEEAVDLGRFFIEMGVSLDDYDNLREQPIHKAVLMGQYEVVKLYLDHGSNVNALTGSGDSLLHMAVQSGKITVTETLLKRGASVGLKTINGFTPLHIACRLPDYDRSRSNVIRLLLSAGEDVLDEDNYGKTPLALITSKVDINRLEQESWPLIEALALKKALKPSIKLKDEMIIERYQKLRDYYQKCSEEIDRMKRKRFTDTCTFFELLMKSQCQIAALMGNPDFETKFRLYDLNEEFSIYAGDTLRAFERAQKRYHAMLEQANVIDEAVYNVLPYLVVQKVVHYMFDCCKNMK